MKTAVVTFDSTGYGGQGWRGKRASRPQGNKALWNNDKGSEATPSGVDMHHITSHSKPY